VEITSERTTRRSRMTDISTTNDSLLSLARVKAAILGPSKTSRTPNLKLIGRKSSTTRTTRLLLTRATSSLPKMTEQISNEKNQDRIEQHCK
jgi:hypothetical protein